MKRLFKWLAVIFAIFGVMILVGWFIISSLFESGPVVMSNSYLAIGLGGAIEEYQPPDAIDDYLSGVAIDMKKFRQGLKMAAADERITGVVVRVHPLSCGLAKLQEMTDLIKTFRKSGKKILAQLDIGTIKEYYVASACDSVYLQPEGTLLLSGLSAQVTFYKGLFDKIGVQADFEHVGHYKNAPDAYTRQNMSDAQREVINNLLDHYFEDIVQTIAENRGLQKSEVRRLILDVSGFTVKEALHYKLIDGSLYDRQVVGHLGKSPEPERLNLAEYSRLDPQSLGLENGGRIAVIHCSGTIAAGNDGRDPAFGTILGAQRVVKNIRAAADRRSVKAIILRIDSPGGSAIASDRIWNAVVYARQKKPVIASISDLGASGGYYFALAADTILVQPQSLVGSIGVFVGKFSLQKLYQKLNLKTEIIKRGQNAGLFSMHSTFSKSERRLVRKLISDFYHNFVAKTAEERKLTLNQADEVAQGRVWLGIEALENKLADGIGGMDEAIAIAVKKARMPENEDPQLVHYPRKKSILNQILNKVYVRTDNPLAWLERLTSIFSSWQSRPLALMPYNITF